MLTLSTPYLVATLFLASIPVADQSLAQAGPPCGDRQQILDQLFRNYGEQVIAYGVSITGGLLQVLKSGPDAPKDTWTILYSLSKDRVCYLASGTGWREVLPRPTGPKT